MVRCKKLANVPLYFHYPIILRENLSKNRKLVAQPLVLAPNACRNAGHVSTLMSFGDKTGYVTKAGVERRMNWTEWIRASPSGP